MTSFLEGSNLRMRRAVARRWHGGCGQLGVRRQCDSAAVGGVAGEWTGREKIKRWCGIKIKNSWLLLVPPRRLPSY